MNKCEKCGIPGGKQFHVCLDLSQPEAKVVDRPSRRTMTDEHRQAISEAQKRRWQNKRMDGLSIGG